MDKDTNQVVVDFIMSKINPFYVEAYNVLAKLKYPIEDYRAFCDQLPLDDAEGLHKFVRSLLGPQAMPIHTVQGAMEKFHATLLAMLALRRPTPHNPREDVEVPKGGPTKMAPDEILRLCAAFAHEEAAKLGNSDPRRYLSVYLNNYFDCIRRLSEASEPPQPEDFIGP